MSFSNTGTPWGLIQAKKKLVQAEEKAEKLRIKLVKIGEEVLQDIENGKVPSEDVIKRFGDFIDNARSKGIYKS